MLWASPPQSGHLSSFGHSLARLNSRLNDFRQLKHANAMLYGVGTYYPLSHNDAIKGEQLVASPAAAGRDV